MTAMTAHYQKPGFATKHVFNPLIEFATTLGLSMRGSRVLAVQGRTSGKWYTTPVNPLPFEGERYLVAPRGETGWVKNIRVSHEGRLKLGRKTETIHVTELPDSDKLAIIRAYLKLWAAETKVFFALESANPSDEELTAIAPRHPVFRIDRS